MAKGKMYHLKEWNLLGLRLSGIRIEDGKEVVTADIVLRLGNNVVTKSGSKYVLGEPHANFLISCENRGIVIDTKSLSQAVKDLQDAYDKEFG